MLVFKLLVVPLLGVVSGKSHHKDAKTLRTLKKTFRRTIISAWLRDFVVKLIDPVTQQHLRGAQTLSERGLSSYDRSNINCVC